MDSDTFWNGVCEAMLQAPFEKRGFSYQTIEVLVDCSIDAPERLLFMTQKQLKQIPGIDKTSLAEIKAYRAKFIR
jgi:hypothetical protein